MIGARMQEFSRRTVERMIAPLGRTNLDPNALTIAGFAMSFATATVIALGWRQVGGVLVLITGGFDMLDGALARVRKVNSTFGAFLDSTLDRWAEGVIFTGIMWYLEANDFRLEAVLAMTTLVGSMLISYTRARAEGLGLECKVGVLQRPERLLLLGVALLGPHWFMTGAFWVLAVTTQATALQRVFHVHRQIERQKGDRT